MKNFGKYFIKGLIADFKENNNYLIYKIIKIININIKINFNLYILNNKVFIIIYKI